MVQVLAAGDRFIRARRLKSSLTATLGPDASVRELEFAWPDEPFGDVGEVSEAAGDEDGLIAALAGCEAIATQLAPMTRRVMAACPDLRMIAVSRGGPTNVNLEAARELGIRVANVPGRNGIATAEMTIGLLLSLLRGIPAAHASVVDSRWRGDLYREDAVGGEVLGSTIGLLGAGAVGAHVAKVLHAMGATVLVYDPYLRDGALADGIERVDTPETLFTRSDVVSVHARLTPESHHMVNAARLRLMPRGGLLVNAARGGLVDYDAVADAIESGHLGGAAFDVYPEEPVDFDRRIVRLAREQRDVVLTPHIAGASTQTAQRAADGVAEEVRRYFAGEPALNPLTEPTGVAALR